MQVNALLKKAAPAPAKTAKAPANLQRWLIRKRLECNATWVRATPGSCACGEETTDAAHELLHCELLEEIRQPFLQALANFRQKALLAGKRLTDEEADMMLKIADKDGDGVLQYDEIIEILADTSVAQ